ncbi:MAG: hypothetical protein U0T69_12255 [Chitinophagales bacterium]
MDRRFGSYLQSDHITLSTTTTTYTVIGTATSGCTDTAVSTVTVNLNHQ